MADETQFGGLAPRNSLAITDRLQVMDAAGVPYRSTFPLPTIDTTGALGINVSTPSVYSARVAFKSGVSEAALALDAPGGTNTGINFYTAGSPAYTLQALTTGGFRLYDFVNAKEMWRASASGVFTIASGTTASGANLYQSASGDQIVRSTSSRRYKRNIEPLGAKYADAILQAETVWYQSKASADNPAWGYYGLIAEDLAEIDPRLVHWGYQEDQYEEVRVSPARKAKPAVVDAEGNEIAAAQPAVAASYERRLKKGEQLRPDGVQYDRLVVPLLNIVQRQQAQLAELAGRLAVLEAAGKARQR